MALVTLCCAGFALADSDAFVVSDATENLPELARWARPALERALAARPAATAPCIAIVGAVDCSNGQEHHQRLFANGLRHVATRGYVDTWVTLSVKGELWAMDPSGVVVRDRRRFFGRTSARLDYDPWLRSNRARREHAGFLLPGGSENPVGPLIEAAFENALADPELARWLDGLGRSGPVGPIAQ